MRFLDLEAEIRDSEDPNGAYEKLHAYNASQSVKLCHKP